MLHTDFNFDCNKKAAEVEEKIEQLPRRTPIQFTSGTPLTEDIKGHPTTKNRCFPKRILLEGSSDHRDRLLVSEGSRQ